MEAIDSLQMILDLIEIQAIKIISLILQGNQSKSFTPEVNSC